jgi:nitroimidazol reductase NimA-like FMN-containing flavoprotein (pyridoxamine 5'-phosphate oxidase superfamily)
MARKETAMTPAEVDEFMQTGRNLQVATLGADAWPHLTTLWYVMRGGLVAFRSFRRSQRIVNLRRDPKITVLLEAGDSYDALRGVMVKGRAELVDDRDVVLEVYAAVASKYQFDGAPLDPAAVEALFGEYADRNTAVIVHPEQTASWDHRKLDGSY